MVTLKKTIAAAALTVATLTLIACNGNGRRDSNSNPTGKVFGPDTRGTGAPRTDDSTYPHRYDPSTDSGRVNSGGSMYNSR